MIENQQNVFLIMIQALIREDEVPKMHSSDKQMISAFFFPKNFQISC